MRNFAEYGLGEVPRIPLPRTPVNSPSRVRGAPMDGTMGASLRKGPLAASYREELLPYVHTQHH
jgi:hypothetical protein